MAYKFNPFTSKLEEYGPILTGTGTVSAAADGTAALPGIAFANDLNTGIYRPGVDQLALSTNGNGRLFISSTGLVGIGTSSPGELLTVGGATANIGIFNSVLGSNASPSSSKINFYGYSQTANGNIASISAINTQQNTFGGVLQFATNTALGAHTTALTIDSSQRVGIGTTSPQNRFVVSNSGAEGIEFIPAATSNQNQIFHYNRSTSSYISFSSYATEHIFRNASNETARIDSSGRLLVGTSSATDSGSTTAAKFVIKEDTAAVVQKLDGNFIDTGSGTTNGRAQKLTVVRHYPVVSLGTKLIIPFTSQGNAWQRTVCRVMGCSARFNTATPLGFEVSFTVGHLDSLSNLGSWGGGGNYASIAINGMNVEITFTTAYTSATTNGVEVCLEYLTTRGGASIDVANIAMN